MLMVRPTLGVQCLSTPTWLFPPVSLTSRQHQLVDFNITCKHVWQVIDTSVTAPHASRRGLLRSCTDALPPQSKSRSSLLKMLNVLQEGLPLPTSYTQFLKSRSGQALSLFNFCRLFRPPVSSDYSTSVLRKACVLYPQV